MWRRRLMKETKDTLDHPETLNKRVLQRAVDIYRADPKNAVPQPKSLPSKFESKGKVYAMLQALRHTHARQLYDIVLEEEERDQKRIQLMDWLKMIQNVLRNWWFDSGKNESAGEISFLKYNTTTN